MIPRYAIINVSKRDEFEKELQLPYGYYNCFITGKLDVAIKELKSFPIIYKDCSIEKIDENGREVIYTQ